MRRRPRAEQPANPRYQKPRTPLPAPRTRVTEWRYAPTEIGPIELDVPRDRDGTFEPATVRKGQRRLNGVDEMVISLTAKGLTTGEVEAHLAEVYGTTVSRETISKITDRVLGELVEWQNRPLDRGVYPVIFIDAIVVKIRDGQVANRPVYAAIGVTVDGKRDILGLWIGTGGEGAKYWLQVLAEIKNRGVEDPCIVVCDGRAEHYAWPDVVEWLRESGTSVDVGDDGIEVARTIMRANETVRSHQLVKS